MTGFDLAPTPYQGTRFRIDTPETVLQEMPSEEYRSGEVLSTASPAKDVRFVKDTGVQLKPYQADVGHAAERSAAQAGIMKTQADGGTLQASGLLQKFAGYRQRTDTGATYGADNVTSGDDHYEVQVPAGQHFTDADLTADKTAFPGIPGDSADPDVVRLVVDTVVDEPDKPLHLKITVPMAITGGHKSLGTVYFTGPASQSKDAAGNVQGLGQYGFRINGDGTADLWERQKLVDFTDPQWVVVQRGMRWCPMAMVAGAAHAIEILTREFDAPRGNRTGYVVINVQDSGSSTFGGGTPLTMGMNANPSGFLKYYATCTDPKKWKPAEHVPVRKEVRADAAPVFQLSRPIYPTTGYFVDGEYDTYVIPGFPDTQYTVYWLGSVPSTGSVDIALYAEDQDPITGMAITPLGTGNFASGGYARFHLPTTGDGVNAQRSFRVKITLNGDGYSTPTIEEVGTFKEGSAVRYDVGETIVDHPIGEYSMSGQDFTTGRESCSITYADIKGEGTALSFRSKMPFRIDVPYPASGLDVDESSPRSILFRGYVSSALSQKLYRDDRQGIDANARQYTIELVGMHQRLDEAAIPYGFSLAIDRNQKGLKGHNLPALASDAIRRLIICCGFTEDEVGWDEGDPLYPTRMFASDRSSAPNNVNYLTPLGELAMRIARDYLGRYLIYCPNSSRVAPSEGEDPTGMWRMVEPPYPPYKPLARFETAPVSGGEGLYFGHVPWPDWTFSGQAVPVRPFFRGETKLPVAPEFNMLLVSGVAGVGSPAGPNKLTTIVPNTLSFDPIPTITQSDATNVNFIGRPVRLIYVNGDLNTPYAVQFAARRLLDFAGTGYLQRSFTAPLVLVDDGDQYLRRKRPLRPNDCIVFRGRMCVVKSAAIFAKKDGHQMYRIECQELPADPDNPIG